jgi:hypothetical protein
MFSGVGKANWVATGCAPEHPQFSMFSQVIGRFFSGQTGGFIDGRLVHPFDHRESLMQDARPEVHR